MNPLAKHGRLSYLELPAIDGRASATFYERVCGWRIDDRGGGDFRFGDAEGTMIGRFDTARAAAREGGMLPNFYVVGLDGAVARATQNGGALVQPVRAEGDVRVARVRDPAGNVIGLWEFGAP